MASAAPPLSILALFNRPGERAYFMVDSHSYELACDPGTGRWHFYGEHCLDDDEPEPRRYDDAIAYPEPMNERVRRAAAFARAWFDFDVDERIGIAAFGRVGNPGRCQ